MVNKIIDELNVLIYHQTGFIGTGWVVYVGIACAFIREFDGKHTRLSCQDWAGQADVADLKVGRSHQESRIWSCPRTR